MKNKRSFLRRHWVGIVIILFLLIVIATSFVGFLIYLDKNNYDITISNQPQTDPIYEKHIEIVNTAKADFEYMNSLIKRWNANLNKIDDGTLVAEAVSISNEFTEFIYTDLTSHTKVVDGDFYNNNAKYLNQRYGVSLEMESQLEDNYEIYYDYYEQIKYQAERMKENNDLAKQEDELAKMYLNVLSAII